MSAIIEIRDGTPWWASTDIWVVPGDDPNGPVGAPRAGLNNYVWARVRNGGTTAATGIQVNFYWSNPAAGVLRSNSPLIGTSNVDLDPGEAKEVLCVAPWQPVVVNGGHECLVAEAVTPLDPLPTPRPDAFDPPAYRQVAQINLQVVALGTKMLRSVVLPVQLSASARQAKQVEVRLTAAPNGADLAARLLKHLNLPPLPYQERLVHASLAEQGGCAPPDPKGPQQLRLEIPAGTARAVYVRAALADNARPGVQLLHLEELVHGKLVGGNSVLLIHNA